MKYAWIEKERDHYPVSMMCRVLGVSRSGFYAWRKRPLSKQAHRREQSAQEVREVYEASHGIYGYRKVHRELQARGVTCCLETTWKLMSAAGLLYRVKRRFVVTTTSDHSLPVAENVLNRDFSASGPNQKWAADITYIPTEEGWLYLAVVIDLFSRRIVGWAASASLQAELALDALKMAIHLREPGEGLVHHSDRAIQYACDAYIELLETQLLIPSMSRTGDFWDNAPVECFVSSDN